MPVLAGGRDRSRLRRPHLEAAAADPVAAGSRCLGSRRRLRPAFVPSRGLLGIPLRPRLAGALLIGALLLTGCGQKDSPRAAYERLANVTGTEPPAQLADLVTHDSLLELERIRDLALDASGAELADESSFAKLMVVELRHRFDADSLARMTGAEILSQAIRDGVINTKLPHSIGLGKLTVVGGKASAHLVRGDREMVVEYRFAKENGRWKVDLRGPFSFAGQALELVAAQQKVPVDDFILQTVTQQSGRAVDPSIWTTPLRGR
jgi:hypothetical protein